MNRYRMDDGTVVDTDKSQAHWREAKFWDGRDHISKATGNQWTHETLYKSCKGRYYIEHISQWQGTRPHTEWVSPEEAARWLLHNEHDLPVDLERYAEEITE